MNVVARVIEAELATEFQARYEPERGADGIDFEGALGSRNGVPVFIESRHACVLHSTFAVASHEGGSHKDRNSVYGQVSQVSERLEHL
jgi:hypothetical protein